MNKKLQAYGNLCSLFYDTVEAYAPEHEVSFYASFMDKDSRVLEAMSGSGRLQIPLLQRGYQVDGVDSSAHMLERCRQRCAALHLTPTLYQQSLEEFSTEHNYKTVTIAIASFQLIVDRAAALSALKNLHAHMVEGGDLLIDIFVPDVQTGYQSTRIAHVDSHTIIRLTTYYVMHQQEQIVEAFCIYELMVDGIVLQEEQELIRLVWYTDLDLTTLLEQAGFEVVKIYEESFREASPSRIVHARAVFKKSR
ncbi:MAG: class I SAM-dependent methyltransferase [Candidatus Dependentiae bacterium]|nr:class I SAM-dependent methyltransferase [Candidatus Dependentiae bacterium]